MIEELERQSIRQNASFFSFSTTSFVRYCSQRPLPEGNAEDILMLFCTSKCRKSGTMPPSRQEIVPPIYISCLRSNLGCYLFPLWNLRRCVYPPLHASDCPSVPEAPGSVRQADQFSVSAAFRFECLNFSPPKRYPKESCRGFVVC